MLASAPTSSAPKTWGALTKPALGPGQSWQISPPWCADCSEYSGSNKTPWVAVKSRSGVSAPPSSVANLFFVASPPSTDFTFQLSRPRSTENRGETRYPEVSSEQGSPGCRVPKKVTWRCLGGGLVSLSITDRA